MFRGFGRYANEAISGVDEDTKLLENRKPRQYHNQGQVHPRKSKPYNFAEPSYSKASLSRGEDKELNTNEVISGLRHMRKKIHRKSLLSPKSIPQLTQTEYDAWQIFGDPNEVLNLAMTNTNHKPTNELMYDQKTLIKALGTHKVAARAEVNATTPNDTGTAKRKGLRFGGTKDLLRHLAITQSSNRHMQRQARHGLTRTSTRIAETSHTEFKPIDNKIHSIIDRKPLKTSAFLYDLQRQTKSQIDSLIVNDDQSTDNAQKNDSAVTQDERLTDTSPKLNPPSHTAAYNTFVNQHYDMRRYMQSSNPHEQPYLDLMEQTQASSAPTGHPISFHHPGSTQLRQKYEASLPNIRAVQSFGRRGVPVGIKKDKTFEKLSNAFSASGHYTISQDHTAGEETRRSHLLANFGRRCGANTDERKQLEVANGELNFTWGRD